MHDDHATISTRQRFSTPRLSLENIKTRYHTSHEKLAYLALCRRGQNCGATNVNISEKMKRT